MAAKNADRGKGAERLRLRVLALLMRKMPALLAGGHRVDPRLIEMWERKRRLRRPQQA